MDGEKKKKKTWKFGPFDTGEAELSPCHSYAIVRRRITYSDYKAILDFYEGQYNIIKFDSAVPQGLDDAIVYPNGINGLRLNLVRSVLIDAGERMAYVFFTASDDNERTLAFVVGKNFMAVVAPLRVLDWDEKFEDTWNVHDYSPWKVNDIPATFFEKKVQPLF